MPQRHQIVIATVSLAFCATAQATISLPTITPVPIPTGTLITDGGGATLDNYVSQDLFVNTSLDWTTAVIVLELTQGTIYQDVSGHSTYYDDDYRPPNPTLLGQPGYESLEYDTYLTFPDSAAYTNWLGYTGGAGDLNSVPWQFDQTQLSMSWSSLGHDDQDIGASRITRVTLSDDAQGTWSLAITEKYSRAYKYLYNPISNGQMISDPLPGDLNYDGFVGIEDLNHILGPWNQTVTADDRTAGDPSGDGFVGIEDMNIVLGNWNTGLVPLQPDSVTGMLWDANRDGFVGIEDHNIVLSNWNLTVPPGDPRADMTGDGFVGIEDKPHASWNYGTPPQPIPGGTPPAVVPEPAALCWIGVGVTALLRRRA